MTATAKTWDVTVWASENRAQVSRSFATKEEAYQFANSPEVIRAFAIEVYGPDGYYDAN